MFDKGKLKVISARGETDFSRASLNDSLSAVDFDKENKFFYITIDKVLFADPVSTIRTVLDAHGYTANLENILSCLDSFVFAAHARLPSGDASGEGVARVNDYLPCVRFELPQRNKIGPLLQSFYDEIARFEEGIDSDKAAPWSQDPDVYRLKALKAELEELKAEQRELQEQVSVLTQQLSREQKSLSRASKALDSQGLLPDNAKIGRVEKIELKRRRVQVKCQRQVIELPTHMLDRVPEYQARCLIALDETGEKPTGVVFFGNEQLADLENRTAELLYVDGDSFKARDSHRNEFQIKAVNELEAATIATLRRGTQVVLSLADGFVVRFALLGATLAGNFVHRVEEQFIVHDIARNQLVRVAETDKQTSRSQ